MPLTHRQAKILTHVRCHMDDVKVAVETGVDGVYAAKLSAATTEYGQWPTNNVAATS